MEGATDRYGFGVMYGARWITWAEDGKKLVRVHRVSYGTDALDQVTVSRWRPGGQSSVP